MKKPAESFSKPIVFAIIIGGLIYIWVLLFGPAAQQSKNLQIAEEFSKQTLTPLIKKHEKFHDIQTGVHTGKGGCIAIRGWTETEEDFNELKKLIESKNPPLFIRYTVKIEEIEFKKEETNSDKESR